MTQASPAQHGMWITAVGGTSAAYHMPIVIRFGADLDTGALAKACAAVADRHPLLATAVEDRDGVAHLVPAPAPFLRLAAEGDSPDEEIARPFDLVEGPLVRLALYDGPTLVITAHHLVFDGSSKDILVRDLAAAYNGEIAPAPAVTFAEHAAGERDRISAAAPAAAAFWADRWVEPLPLVVADRVLTSRQAGPGAVVEFPLAVPAVDGVTRFEAVLAAVHALLHRYGNARVTTAVDLSTRGTGVADVIGPMVNELPVDSEPVAGTPFDEYARSMRATLRAIYPHRDVPLARAVARIRPHAALAPISVSYRKRRPAPAFVGVDAAVEWMAFNGAVRGDLQLQIVDSGTDLAASLRYSPAAAPIAARFADDLRSLTERLAAQPALPLESARTVAPADAGAATELTAGDRSDATGGELADRIRAIWEEVLGISPIADDDDLFDLGGHSLTMTQIIARMRKNLEIEVPMDVFFDDPTINGVVDAVASEH